MALTENLFIYKDTLVLCKILLKYSKTVSKIVRYSTYNEAVSKACAALDMIRRINESWTERDEHIHEYIYCSCRKSTQGSTSSRMLSF